MLSVFSQPCTKGVAQKGFIGHFIAIIACLDLRVLGLSEFHVCRRCQAWNSGQESRNLSAAFPLSSDAPAPEASALFQEENPRNQLMALMLLTAQPQVRFASLFLPRAGSVPPKCGPGALSRAWSGSRLEVKVSAIRKQASRGASFSLPVTPYPPPDLTAWKQPFSRGPLGVDDHAHSFISGVGAV